MKHPMELMGPTLNTLDAGFLQFSDKALKGLKAIEPKLIAPNDQERLVKLWQDIARLEKMRDEEAARIRKRLS
jgi:hypothetical protein